MTNYLDNSVVDELKLIMEDEINMLYSAYLEDSVERINELKLASEKLDCDLTRRVAHTLKGSSRNVGASNLSELCELLEQAARNEETASWGALVSQIVTSFSATKNQIEQEVLTS
jgi:HPt (histidine-containing phosphotransfer) domain-containing protein